MTLQINQSKTQSTSNIYVKMLSGSVGGLIEAITCQPLDVVKTRLQLDKNKNYKGMFNCMNHIYKTEGFASMYKGLTPFMTHLTLKYALRYGSYDHMKYQLNYMLPLSIPFRKTYVDLMAGTFAGATEAVLIVTPFEVIKTRLQIQKGLNKNTWAYKNPIDCAHKIFKQEGFGGLWKGVTATVIRQSSNQAANFTTVGLINHNIWNKNDGDGKVLPLWKTFSTGLIAGAVGPCINQPFDVAKSRLQAQKNEGKYHSTIHTMKTVVKEEGFSAIYRGLGPRLLRVAPGQAITWMTVLRVQSIFENK